MNSYIPEEVELVLMSLTKEPYHVLTLNILLALSQKLQYLVDVQMDVQQQDHMLFKFQYKQGVTYSTHGEILM